MCSPCSRGADTMSGVSICGRKTRARCHTRARTSTTLSNGSTGTCIRLTNRGWDAISRGTTGESHDELGKKPHGIGAMETYGQAPTAHSPRTWRRTGWASPTFTTVTLPSSGSVPHQSGDSSLLGILPVRESIRIDPWHYKDRHARLRVVDDVYIHPVLAVKMDRVAVDKVLFSVALRGFLARSGSEREPAIASCARTC